MFVCACVCVWGTGFRRGMNKKDAHATLKGEDKVGEQQMSRTTPKPPHLE